MIDVELDTVIPSAIVALLGDDAVAAILDDVAAAARAAWVRLAQTEVHSAKRDYIQGIQPVESEGLERNIALAGWLPNAVEQGIDAFDLRTTLLGGGKGHTSKDGHQYRAIPFRHGTPGGAGQAGSPMGERLGPQGRDSRAWGAGGLMGRAAAAQMGKGIYARAKELADGQRLGTRAGTGYVPVRESATKTTILQVPKLAPWHKTDIFAGMRRETKTYENATQAQYSTFRTISDATHVGWIHPGIQARHLAERVDEQLGGIVAKAVEAAVSSALGQQP